MLYYILPLPVLLGALFYARKQKFDMPTIALLCAAIGLYYFHFYHARWDEFSIDASAHAEYVTYIAKHNALPSPNENMATRHPPAFYLLSAAFYKLGEVEQMQDPLMMARHAPMLCFILFTLMSVNLLRLLLPNPGGGYYAALILLLFWPIGATMGARISCDIMLYAAEAGTLYALVLWLQEKSVSSLSAAFIWAGIAELAKNSGLIVLLITFIILFFALIQHRKNLRALLRPGLAASILFALLCCVLTFAHEHGAWTATNILSGQLDLSPAAWWHMFGSFNIFLFVFDTDMGLSKDYFWNMLLHSLMLGNGAMVWKATTLPILFNILWLAIIVYFLAGLLRLGRAVMPEKKVALLLAGFTFIMVFAMMLMRMRIGNVEYSDARYIYPVVAVVALLHGRVMECHLRAERMRSYRLGQGIAYSFLLLTPALFLVQYYGI